jgi:hypothetical protein
MVGGWVYVPPGCRTAVLLMLLRVCPRPTADHQPLPPGTPPPCVNSAQHGTARHGTARHGTARHGTARHGTARHGTARHGTARHGTARHGTERHGTARNGTARNGTAQQIQARTSTPSNKVLTLVRATHLKLVGDIPGLSDKHCPLGGNTPCRQDHGVLLMPVHTSGVFCEYGANPPARSTSTRVGPPHQAGGNNHCPNNSCCRRQC